jgi:parvulin-like peptidyl-prolyl isomerase
MNSWPKSRFICAASIAYLLTCSSIALATSASTTSNNSKNAVGKKIYQQEWTSLSDSTVDAIIANVGGEILLFSDLRRAINLATKGQGDLLPSGKLTGPGLNEKLAEDVFDKLIEQTLLELKVQELSLQVTDEELDREIASFLESKQISRPDFLKMLESEGETEQSHRSEFKRQLETQRFIGRVIRPLVIVTEDEVRSYYLSENKNKAADSGPEKLVLRSLLLKIAKDSPDYTSKVQEIQEALKGGKAFEEVVKEFSEAPDAKEKLGLLDAKKPSELPQQVVEKLKDEAAGKVVGPISIGSSTFFFELVRRETAADTAFNNEKEKWNTKLLEKKFAERLKSYLSAEKDKVKISKRPIQFKS